MTLGAMNLDVLSRASDELAIDELRDKLLGDGRLNGVVVLGLAGSDDVDLRGERGGDRGSLASGGLEEDGGTVGLVERDLVDGAVGLDLDLLGVDHLNGGNDTDEVNT